MARVAAEPERAALLVGLKPALRLRLDPGARAEVVARYLEAGFAVEGEGGLVYVAREAERARELAALDRELRGLVFGRRYRSLLRRIGDRLGYPRCCVEAFAARARRYPERLLARLPGYRAEAYRSACAAWVPAPRARLNPLLGGIEARLLSFEPCFFDCEAAHAWADRLSLALAEEDPSGAAALDRALAQDVVVHPRGAVATVRVEGGRIAEARPVPRFAGAAPTAEARRAAAALIGRALRSGGQVERRDTGKRGLSPIFIRFSEQKPN